MVWLRIDADAPLSPKVASLRSDAIRWIWFETICASKRQKVGGIFANASLWQKAVNPAIRSALKDLISAGLVERGDSLCQRCVEAYGEVKKDALVVHDFHDYNIDATSTHRTRRYRERLRATLDDTSHERSRNVPRTEMKRTTVRNDTETDTNTDTARLFDKPNGKLRVHGVEGVATTMRRMLEE